MTTMTTTDPMLDPKPTIDEIVIGDPPDAWAAAGFSVDDDGVCRIGTVRVRLVGRDRGKRILDWSLRDTTPGTLTAGTIDGIATRTSESPAAKPATHPNGTLSIDHVVLFTPDGTRTTGALEAVGFKALRVRDTSNYGAPMRQTFFKAGEVILELIGPEEAAGDGSGDGSGDAPAGFFGLALTVDDLDATAARLGEALGAPKDAVQPGRRIATLRHRDLGMSVAIALMTPEPGAVTTG
jgi:hypothetical protein